ncbi:hypothetical protein PtA15_17A30 [Puccinia triticina]|uniref:Uncharacterized protein n=1 Tax=Puccinia triticina TaxID=208348 RepID=A0ABY7D4J0_9BASI|nr:uncharacterized protein PtA15_17A30 [Puccinia triticina]WAQ92549.1 hypothetical protein PtA15_17A30 [Puccinia triticina]
MSNMGPVIKGQVKYLCNGDAPFRAIGAVLFLVVSDDVWQFHIGSITGNSFVHVQGRLITEAQGPDTIPVLGHIYIRRLISARGR